MSSYSEKLLINCVHAVPGGCMCIIYFLHSKCDTYSLLANIHDPENRSQKLNEIHRREFSHWNCYTDSLAFLARFHHCHQALAMINNATNDSLANWIVLWTLTYPVLLVKTLRLLIQLQWPLSNRFMPNPDCMFCHSDVRKSRKHIIWQKSAYPNLNLVVEKLYSKLQKLKTRSWFLSMDQGIGPLCLWNPVPPNLSEKVHNTPRTMAQCGCR